MTLRVCSLGSGSRGNALLVESENTLLLVDCGLSLRTLQARMRAAGREPDDLTALLVTHEHGDHSRGIRTLIGRFELPVYATRGTAAAVTAIDDYEPIGFGRALEIGSIDVTAFPVPHDAREPCQFVFGHAGTRVGLLTDTGHVTAHIVEHLAGCDALALEFNHDADALRAGPYPESVKARVASDYGHLNNEQSAALLARIGHPGLQWVLGLHLSETNNSPDLVVDSLASQRDDSSFELHLAAQDRPCDWLALE